MILDGADVFWSRQMEVGWPGLQADAEGNQVLCGIYGTRWIEYLTVHRFDEHDRMAEVFANHCRTRCSSYGHDTTSAAAYRNRRREAVAHCLTWAWIEATSLCSNRPAAAGASPSISSS